MTVLAQAYDALAGVVVDAPQGHALCGADLASTLAVEATLLGRELAGLVVPVFS